MAYYTYMLMMNDEGNGYRIDEIEENETVFQSAFEYANESDAERAAQSHISDLEESSDAT